MIADQEKPIILALFLEDFCFVLLVSDSLASLLKFPRSMSDEGVFVGKDCLFLFVMHSFDTLRLFIIEVAKGSVTCCGYELLLFD